MIDWENCGLADPAQELPMAIDFGLVINAGLPSCTCPTLTPAAGSDQRLRLIHHGDRTVRPLLGVGDHLLPSNRRLQEKAHSLDRIAELLNPALRVTHLEEMLDTIASAR